ncbi:hypothetical protein HHK36_033350 [Tetracentron sinense]|uniref:Uncharacterized protein n=1 Tax=Tetracentron sinense TaxID=13715 RepID=A0A834Y652_TETSI|nr:hypothetical protein HHK36_033350 [Tetracentron sinense]
MGLLRSPAMLLPLIWILWWPELRAQSPGASRDSARSLDALLQDYAFRTFTNPRTGILYHGNVPSNLTGIEISAMRLRSGSLRTRGVEGYNEFEIPEGVVVQPYVERLVLVYQNLGNRSVVYYPLQGYTYLAPILGLLAYNASNLSATNLPELDIRASDKPISIKFMDVKLVPEGSAAKCVWFDLQGQGQVEFSNVVSGNICSTVKHGHFSIVVESNVPPPAPSPGGGRKKKSKSKVWIIVGSVVGGFVLLILLGFLVFWVRRFKHRKKLEKMEKAADVGEALQMTSIGNTRAPVAMGTRTEPVLENEYVSCLISYSRLGYPTMYLSNKQLPNEASLSVYQYAFRSSQTSTIDANSLASPSSSGILPDSPFPDSSNTCSPLNFPKDSGIDPPKGLWDSTNVLIEAMEGWSLMFLSIGPMNRLLERSMELNLPNGSSILFENMVFKLPVSLLEWRSRSIRSQRFLNSSGIDEWKPLFDKLRKERLVMFPIQRGSFPDNLLLDKSSIEIEDEDNQLLGIWPTIPVRANIRRKRFNLASQSGILTSPRGLKDRSKVCNPDNLASWGGS